jgi:C-terminal peptidase prc
MRLWIAATNGLLQSLDPHSMVISRRAWDDATRKTQDASFEGIGAILTQNAGRTLIENPMRGLPAWRAGIRAGDEIVQVDGRPVAGLALDAIVRVIRGPRDTTVLLGIRRSDAPAMLNISVKRARVAMPNVSGELLADHSGVAHVRMNGFVQMSTVDLRAKIRALSKAAPGGQLRGLILDLRGNGGGLLDQGLEVADMFLPHGRIVGIRGRRGMLRGTDDEVHQARRQPGWDLDIPLVLLVDDSSASASEIVAAALQDNGRALVVGLRTFGKGSVQRLIEATSDYYVKLTMWRYQAPSGRTIQVNGVQPDLVVGPDPKGTIPAGFREEDLASHLDGTPDVRAGPLAPMLGALGECERRDGKTKGLLNARRGSRIRADYQLLRAADLVGCVARLQTGR